MEDQVLKVDRQDGVVVWTLNRPQVMNALNMALLQTMRTELEKIRFDTSVRVVIVTGAGDTAFCAGADLKERRGMAPEQVKAYIHTIRDLFAAVENLNKPVLAAVNGVALGGGTELALAADIRLASTNATLGLTETRLAIIPGAGGTQRLPRLVGRGKAKELIFTGKRIGASEALHIGMVNQLTDPETLMKEAFKMAEIICETGPIAIEQAKYAINYGMETDLQTGMAIESNAYWVCIPTEDRLEGLAAFREKRKPQYKGK
jgi:enoyl-CoA hydratase/carnithine racemase